MSSSSTTTLLGDIPAIRVDVRKGTPGEISIFALTGGPDPRVDRTTTLVVFVHGFPELGYSWRYQIPVVGRLEGFSAIAPDMRGYGRTVSVGRRDVGQFAFENVCEDLVALIQAMGREKAIFVGHDFGGSVVWAMALHHPSRCEAIVALNTPLYTFSPEAIEMMDEVGGPVAMLRTMPPEACGQMDYQAYFCEFEKESDEEMNRDPRRTVLSYFRSQVSPNREENIANMKLGMRTAKTRTPLPNDRNKRPRGVLFLAPLDIPRDPMWSERDIEIYAEAFKRNGFPLGYYRNMDANYQWDRRQMRNENAGKQVSVRANIPCLMMTAANDAVLTPADAARMGERIPDLTVRNLACGHWSMVERREEVNALLLEFLKSKKLGGRGRSGDGKL